MGMKRIYLYIFVINFIFNTNAYSNAIVEKPTVIYSTNYEKSKKLLVSKDKDFFIFTAYNKKSNDVQSCEWKQKLNHQQINILKKSFKNLENKDVIENKLFKITKKKNKIVLIFKRSTCNADHKLYYFQKDCNKEFKIVLPKYKFQEIIENL
jgi:hypothetical protein